MVRSAVRSDAVKADACIAIERRPRSALMRGNGVDGFMA